MLHNVGNVLTSVNLIVHDVQDRLRSTRLNHLHRLVLVLQNEDHRLAEFLTEDPVGSALPGFLAKLDQHLATENKTLTSGVESLRNHCEHIRDIIVAQQSSARLLGVTENLAASQLFDDALQLNEDSLHRHGIILEKIFAEAPRVKADRHKVLQILVNLIKNAKDSVMEAQQANERRIVVSVAVLNEQAVALTVGDNEARALRMRIAAGFSNMASPRRKKGTVLDCRLRARRPGNVRGPDRSQRRAGPGSHVHAQFARDGAGPPMNDLPERNRRILLVDDNPTIHDDFRRTSTADQAPHRSRRRRPTVFFGPAEAAVKAPESAFEIDSALQGQEALALVTAARAAGRPYALAFVDMRMPPGWDGLTTIVKLWEVDPDLQVVICTAYSDRSWDEIRAQLPASERWLVLKKPFDKIEAVQLANALTEKWHLGRMARLEVATLEKMVELRTEQLQRSTRIKNEFLANVSHELLTPMNGIMGMLEVLTATEPCAAQAGYLADASACADDLLSLVATDPGFQPSRGGHVGLEPVEIEPRQRDRRSRCLPSGPRHAQGCRAQDGDRSDVHRHLPDFPRGRQASPGSALVDNAVKFTSEGSVKIRNT